MGSGNQSGRSRRDASSVERHGARSIEQRPRSNVKNASTSTSNAATTWGPGEPVPPPPPALAPPIGTRVGACGGAKGTSSGAGAAARRARTAARGPGAWDDSLSRRATAATPAPPLATEPSAEAGSCSEPEAATGAGAPEPGSVPDAAAIAWARVDSGSLARASSCSSTGTGWRDAARLRDDSVATAGVATDPVATGAVAVATGETTVAPAIAGGVAADDVMSGPGVAGGLVPDPGALGPVGTGDAGAGAIAAGVVAAGGGVACFVALGGVAVRLVVAGVFVALDGPFAAGFFAGAGPLGAGAVADG